MTSIALIARPVLRPLSEFRAWVERRLPDPRFVVLSLLIGYLVLGFTVLGFNRNPLQALLTSVAACLFEFLLVWGFRGRREFPLSALITSCGLSILLNYSHNYYLLVVPVFFAIGSKHLFLFNGKHVFNPAMMGVVLSLLFTNELITSAPAYQWNGVSSMAYFILFPSLMFFMPSINRLPLVASFLATFTLQVGMRALIMRYHLPFMTLFLGTLSSPAFLLFTFFMITDPATSPNGKRDQIVTGVALALIDLAFHLRQSYYTFFYASFTLAAYRLSVNHVRAALASDGGVLAYIERTFIRSRYYLRPLALGSVALAGVFGYQLFIAAPLQARTALSWHMTAIPAEASGINAPFGNVYERLDPRVQHVAKWILSVGDAVASGDFDEDGRPDLFLSLPLKEDGARAALYRNLGDMKFERVPLAEFAERFRDLERYGLPSGGVFVDYDNDGDLDLLITYAFGTPLLLQNQLRETGKATFNDVSEAVGIARYSNSISATFADFNRDGRLDLLIANVLPSNLPDYKSPTPLNLFHLPKPEYEGDRRMFNFMHASWNMADNGGLNDLYLQDSSGKFVLQDHAAWGLTETRWSLAVGAADLNHDGWPDLYIANDFGPDELLLNEGGTHFRNVKGGIFGSIGRDTYKGMNTSIEDVDRNGWQDVYVSNVHHEMQAEGSLLWTFSAAETADPFVPRIEDQATRAGALNERRFGWGAAIADFDNDGWMDIAQANGMVDDSRDKRFEKCPDYWYINEKIARSPPSIHRYADAWGDIRGRCIYGSEADRLYLNEGNQGRFAFTDVAAEVGIGAPGNSRAMGAVDLDNDGRMDLVVTHIFREPSLYRNESKAPSRWIGFSLRGDGKRCNSSAIGTTVTISYRGGHGAIETQTREMQAVSGFGAQGDRRLHFGLGASDSPVTAEVNWCGQLKETFPDLPANRYQTIAMKRGD